MDLIKLIKQKKWKRFQIKMEHLNCVLRLLDKNRYDQWMSLTELNHKTQMRRTSSKFDFCAFRGKMPFNHFGKKRNQFFRSVVMKKISNGGRVWRVGQLLSLNSNL